MKRLTSFIIIMFILSFSITVYADELEDEEIPEPDPHPPSRVIVTDHYLIGDGIIAGEESTLVLKLMNTSNEFPVSSILVSGWLEQGSPVVFIGANQAYMPIIEPGSEIEVQFALYAYNIDLTLISTITSNFVIEYFDESSFNNRSNNVSIKLQISNTTGVMINEGDMQFHTPVISGLEETLFSSEMREVYLTGLTVCCSGIILILLFRLYKRIADSKGGKRNV